MQSSVWVEKYRPAKVEDYIACKQIKDFISNIYKSKSVPNMTLYSPKAGSGKTSLAKMLAKDFCDEDEVLFINGSLNRNIDTIRNEMTDFVYRPTLAGNKKIIIIDEADGINRIAQDSLRGFIESWQNECAFILTCNDASRIIPAITSRCPIIDLTVKPEDKLDVARQVYDRCLHILHDNLIQFDEVAVKNIVKSCFPDIRQIINLLQRASFSGQIVDSNINLQSISSKQDLTEIEEAIISKDWNKIRNWCHNNYNMNNIYSILYENFISKIDIKDVSNFILLTGNYSYKASLTDYSEINLTAYITEIMNRIQFNV